MSKYTILAISVACLAIAACGGPRSTETTSTTRQERTDSGGEVRTSSTQTTEVQDDGSSTTERTVTTQTSTSTPPD